MSVGCAKRALATNHSGDDQNTLAHSTDSCSVVDGVAVPVDSEVELLTSFRNEACDQVTVCGAHYSRSDAMRGEPTLTDIKEYLGRPVTLANGTFSQVVPSAVLTQDLTIANFDLHNRLFGVFGFRATMVFRLQIAANPFQAGVIRMTWQPQVSAANPEFRTINRTAASMMPGVNFDICETTSVVLRVPFVNSWNYYPVNPLAVSGTYSGRYGADPTTVLGCLTLYAYMPLTVAAGGGIPTYHLYGHLEDVELLGASCNDFVNVTPQSGGEVKAVDRPLSAMLSAASRVVALYGGYVPLISSYAGPTSWFLRQGAKLASAFGFSKPLDVQTVTRMQLTQNTYQQNADGFNVAYNVGLMSDNEVAAEPGFAGTDLDEMSLDYVLSVPSCICSGVLTTTDTSYQIKYTCAVCPRSMWFNNFGGAPLNLPFYPSTGTNVSILSTPLSFLGNMFSLWHGDIKFTVRVAKTKFHTGRLLLSYNPGYGDYFAGVGAGKAPALAARKEFNYKSLVWDLREGNVVEFVVPFVSPCTYNMVDQPTGAFCISVIDPLIAASTVSSSVPFLIEVSALPGFEFASPSTPQLYPAPLASNVYSQSGSEVVKSQFGSRDAMLCIGERITSVKQLISKACPDFTFSGSTTGDWSVAPFYTQEYPTWSGNALVVSTAGITDAGTNPVSWCRYLSMMYAYARGGTSYHIIRNDGLDTGVGFIYALYQTGMQWYDSPLSSSMTCNSYISEKSALHVNVPFYAPTSRVLRGSADAFPSQTGLGPAGLLRVGSSATGVNILVFTHASDDAQLGYFLGTPPLATVQYVPTAYEIALLATMRP